MNSKQLVNTLYGDTARQARIKFAHDIRLQKMAWYRSRPMHFALKVLGSRWWSAQEEVGKALVKHRRVVVRSGNGVGKTYLAADLALWFLYTHSPALVITTAPTWRQVKHVLWHEIRKRLSTARKRLPGKLLQTRIDLGGPSFAVGLATDGGVQFQGFHCENLLIILDEASGIADEIWDAAEGIAVGGNNKILAIGNPLAASGRFYQSFSGSAKWTRLTINALAHPNITRKGARIPGCVTADFIDDKVEEWCEPAGGSNGSNEPPSGTPPTPLTPSTPSVPDVFVWRGRRYRPGDLFRVRVLGEFPNAAGSSLIQLRWIEAAQRRVLPAEGYKRVAADVAHYGEDYTVIGLRVGPVLLDMIPIQGADLMEVSGAIAKLAYAEHPSTIAIDAIGEGAGVASRLIEQGIEGVEPAKGSHKAFDQELFANRRAELYWGLKERFRKGDIRITDDAQLLEELAAIRYRFNSRGQIQIESKEEMKKRVKRSPDRADMLSLLFDNSYEAWAFTAENVPPVRSPSAEFRKEMENW